MGAIMASAQVACIQSLATPVEVFAASARACRSLGHATHRLHYAASTGGVPESTDAVRKAWVGLTAGALCGVGSMLLSGVCACLGCVELGARTCKCASAHMAMRLAASATFGGSVAQARLGYEQHDDSSHLQQHATGAGEEQHGEEAPMPAPADPAAAEPHPGQPPYESSPSPAMPHDGTPYRDGFGLEQEDDVAPSSRHSAHLGSSRLVSAGSQQSSTLLGELASV